MDHMLPVEALLVQQLSARVTALTAQVAKLTPAGVEPEVAGRWAANVEWMRTDELAEAVQLLQRARGIGAILTDLERPRLAQLVEAAESRRGRNERPFTP
jgi:hypothetical protein